MLRLLKPFTGTGSVFFPIGLPPEGTCEFATPECLRHCYMTDEDDFDEETRVSPEEASRVYDAVLLRPISSIVDRFLLDLLGLQTPILHWFGSGDCLSKDVDRISAIIQAMPKSIVQMGFTRNRALWERHKDVFALTIERGDSHPDPDAMYAIPNYEKQTSVMVCPSHRVLGGFCGPLVCKDADRRRPELTHYINCKICHRRKLGCFDRRPQDG
jgi:hypothetical protein